MTTTTTVETPVSTTTAEQSNTIKAIKTVGQVITGLGLVVVVGFGVRYVLNKVTAT